MPKVIITCRYCKSSVIRKLRPSRKDAGIYCSRECAFASASLLKQERQALKRISKKVKKLINANKKKQKKLDYIKTKLKRKCCICGCFFVQKTHLGMPKKYCKECTEVKNTEAKRRTNRIAKSQRRARIRNTKIENIDPFDIFNQYKWQCYICGVSTPKEKRGTCEPNAPELDHVIPLAKGGTHTRENLACCCRTCNNTKSDQIIVGA
ncbi:HNH endonuclease [Moraxella boevrei]|uniref:HNH endonuclease n=1 Tax=Faucicola boevrei TaxID=346665 RepID=UPI00373528A3